MKKLIILIILIMGVILFVKPTQISAQTQGCSNPPIDTGKVTLAATATEGTYKVWARIKAPDTINNSFYIQINNCAVLMGNSTSIPPNIWTWIDYRDGSSTNKVNTTLTSGTHVITLIGNENGVGVDKILMTKDLNCVPTGTSGDNCPAEISASPTLTKTPTPTPTITKAPSPTPTTNSTVLKFQKVFLHGIGKGGDNTKPTSAGNNNPLRTTRSLTVELIESSGNTLPGITGNITYQGSTLGYFAGDITLPTSISSGNYLIKVKSPQYLKKQVLGIVTITKGGVTIIPQISLTTGDTNNNNSLTTADFNIITDCYSDLLPAKNCADSAKKQAADLTDDGKVNQADYNLFLRELSVLAGD